MEITVWAYQIIPGADESLFFALSEDACRTTALEQRKEQKQHDPDHHELPAMAVCEYLLRPLTAAKIVSVLNSEQSLTDACVASRRLVGLVVD